MALGQFLGWGTALTGLFLAAPPPQSDGPTLALTELPSPADLADTRDRLLLEIAELREELVLLEQQRTAVRFLPEEATAYDLVQAQVLYRDPLQVLPSFIINRGSQDGLRAGQPVLGQLSVIGRISAVWGTRARVDLLSRPGVAFGAHDQETRALGVVQADTGELVLSYVAKTSTVNPGDLIVTSGVPGLTPPGLPLGTVAAVSNETEAMTLTISLSPLENPWILELVQVVLTEEAPVPPEALEASDPRLPAP